MHYNFGRVYMSLKDDKGRTQTPQWPQAVATYPWSLTQIAALLD